MNTLTSVTLYYIHLISDEPTTPLQRWALTGKLLKLSQYTIFRCFRSIVLCACHMQPVWTHKTAKKTKHIVLHFIFSSSLWIVWIMCNVLFSHIKGVGINPNITGIQDTGIHIPATTDCLLSLSVCAFVTISHSHLPAPTQVRNCTALLSSGLEPPSPACTPS